MTLLKKLLDLFGKNAGSDSTEKHQAQFKSTITANSMIRPHRNEESPGRSGMFEVIIVGVSFYQEALEKVCGNMREDGIALFKEATIVPYDDSPHDTHAVRVEIGGETVGHLSRKAARIWRSKMISDSISGAVSCPAKIIWDKGAFKEGSYGVWLDIDLSLPDSKPEINIARTVSVPVIESDHIGFLVNQLNRFELSNCKVGDDVGLWVAEGTREIFIYRQGSDYGEGKIGVCPDELFKTIRNAPGCDARIASIYEGGCKIDCRIISKAEMSERMRRVKEEEKAKRAAQEVKLVEKLRVDFDKKYSPKTTIKTTFHLIYHNKLAVGDRIYLDIKSKKYYLRYPRQLRVDLLNHAKEKIGEIRNREPVLRIIKASYNGYDFDLKVESLYGLYSQYDVEFDPCVGETFRYATVEIVPKKEGQDPIVKPIRYNEMLPNK